MSATLRYLFSVPVHISLYFHVLFMPAQLVQCTLSFNLKTFPGWVFNAQKLQVEKCCGHYVADITHYAC